jgi:ABC-type uncharacterized transport system substrate-binding protein
VLRRCSCFQPRCSSSRDDASSSLPQRTDCPPWLRRREFVELGELIAYGANINDLFRRSTVYVDKILKGAKPADLPVEQPTRFELVINLKTARSLDLETPRDLLLGADGVIE